MKQNRTMLLFCLFLSFIFLLICSKTSPLYVFQDWFDANAFMSVGRGIKHGLIPYKDIFEQKGPLLYFLHAIGALISETDFRGIFILQIISFTIFLYYSYKIIKLYLPYKAAYYILPLLSFGILMMKSYRYGDSVEEFSIPIITISIYYLGQLLKSPTKKHYFSFFIMGLSFGIIFWMKYSLLGFFIGFQLFIIIYLFYHKKYKLLLYDEIYFLLGIMITTGPILFYFGINKALKDLINCYFLVNLNSYTISLSMFDRFYLAYKTFFNKIISEKLYGLIIIIGLYQLLKNKKHYELLAIVSCLIFLGLTVYGGGRTYSYYFLIFAPIGLFGLIYIMKKINYHLPSLTKYHSPIIIVIIIILTFSYTLYHHPNTKDLSKKRTDYAQYQFADTINQRKKHATILNYNFLDGGFYLTTNTLPINKYFQKNNISYNAYPNIMQEQNELIKHKSIDFVITLLNNNQTINNLSPNLLKNYKIIQQFTQQVEGREQTYYLLEKK